MERVVVIGASAGGLAALEAICAELPADFPAPILIVMHVAPGDSALLDMLAKRCRLPAAHAVDGQYAEAGTILVAAPGRDLTLINEHGKARVKLTDGGNPYLMRPAIDPLFLSAAAAFRQGVVGIVLSGFLDDGSDGLRTIKAAGGRAMAQDPLDALCPDMPASAIGRVAVDAILRADSIGPALCALVAAPLARPASPAADLAGREPPRQGHGIDAAVAPVLASSALHRK